jgi:hypothetical protein
MIKSNTAFLSALSSRNGLKKDANFISTIITGDECWVFGYDPETMQQSSQWKTAKERVTNLEQCQIDVGFFF